MNIYKVINHFPLDKEDSYLEIFIGKNLNRQLFNINNKIFFDILYSYLIKNGWNLNSQYIIKTIQSKNINLECILNNDVSNILDFDIPFTHNNTIYQKLNNSIQKYKGTYYDILCNYYTKKAIDLEVFQEQMDNAYNETIEEVNTFQRKSTPFTIHMNIEKMPVAQSAYTVKIIITNTITDETPLDELFEIIDLAMAKYKKTDKTISSIFEKC